MSDLLDDFYAVLMGFGIKRDWIDLALLSVLGITDGITLRALIETPLQWDLWAVGVGVGWLTFVCFKYMAKGGGT